MSVADENLSDNTVIQTSAQDRFEVAAQRILSDQLPIPVRERWQPLRIGLMNLFLFEDERFPFADGRLLLRGSNGAGKSRVLAMTLPLLLDGSFKATRVEPDRDSNRQVAWNLLMDDQPSATGYSWLEFGRIDDEGAEHFVTIGCGMKATRGQSIKPWFFITELRVDDTLKLKTIDGVPLTRRQLTEAIDESGKVFDTAHEYRRSVDETLFRLGERYDPLIDLLLQLRQPQLAKKLDIDQLELALREALPPLADSLLDDAAEAFRDLDHYRRSLESDRQTLQNVEQFLKPYREHIARGIKRSLKTLTYASGRYETVQRELKRLADAQQDQETERQQTKEKQASVRLEIESGRAAISELQQSPEMQTAQRLDECIRKASELAEAESEYRNAASDAGVELQSAKQQVSAANQSVDERLKTAIAESENCRKVAAPEELQNKHQSLISALLSKQSFRSGAHAEFASARKKIDGSANRFQKSATHLIQLNQQLAAIDQNVLAAKQNVERAEQSVREKTEILEHAQLRFKNMRTEYWDSVLQWFESATMLHPFLGTIEAWSDQWHAWPADSRDADPSRSLLDRAKQAALTQLTADREHLRQAYDSLETQITTLKDEQTQRESGALIAPPSRNQHLRLAQAQSASVPPLPPDAVPLWKLVDFKSSVPKTERGNWESALHDAGILDAILMPDGGLVAFAEQNTVVQIVTNDLPELEPNRQLSQVLQPSDESVPSEQFSGLIRSLEKVLAVIGVGTGAGATWVSNDGRWQNGPLHGRLTKDHPQYIGREARDRWRRFRLEEIAAETERLRGEQKGIESKVEANLQHGSAVERIVAEFPSSEPLVNANAAETLAQQNSDRAADALQESQSHESEVQQRLTEATQRRDTDAADIGLSAWATRADDLYRKIEAYRLSLKTLDAHVESLQTVVAQAEQVRVAQEQAAVRNQQAADRLTQLQIRLAKANETVSVLRESTGKSVAEMVSRVQAERNLQADREAQAERLQAQYTDITASLAVIANDINRNEIESSEYDERRREATKWFSQMHENSLLELVVDSTTIPELPWSMTAAVKLARSVGVSLANTPDDDDAWQKSQSAVHRAQTELQQTVLSLDGMAVEVEHLRDGLQMVTLSVQGERLAPMAAASRLESDIQNRDQILDAREQDTLEKYLLGEVAEGLRNGMRMAAELVKLMTSEVSKRPMKTGMQMRFKWRRDDQGPTGLAEACEVLETDSATWSATEREQIKQFLHRSISEQRDSEQSGSWHEHLRSALDYRLWHRIVIERRSGPDANWQRLTKRTYGSGSGGEKAIALTLPQLAAAAAYYQSADKLAPRFILLDEAFAGISSDMRESCLELIAAFKLDVVMTSESEWGMYAGVKQLAICQLDRFADINAVVNRVFVWNGAEMRASTTKEEAAEIESQPLFAKD